MTEDSARLVGLFRDQVKKGKVLDLGQAYFAAMPCWPGSPAFGLTVKRMHGEVRDEDGYSACVESCTLNTHMGTHIDALGHVAMNGMLHGGATVDQGRETGLKQLGIEEVPPLVTRGVLLDVAGLKGMDVLPEGYEITPRDCEEAEQFGGVRVMAGDGVFIRTGWSRYFPKPGRFFGAAVPGPGRPAAVWLADRKIRLTGSDTPAFEKTPNRSFPAHVVLLVENGIHILEWLNLEPLVEAKAFEFASFILPLKIVGASGSPVRPIAII